jgi:hypothetical protein
MWEVFSYGEIPYSSMSNKEAVEAVENGYRLPKPKACNEEIYQLMNSCWNMDYKQRPSFEVFTSLSMNF